MFRKFVAILGIAAISVLTAGCDEDKPLEPVSLKLNWRHGSDFIGFYVAAKKGYFKEAGLSVTIEPMLEMSDTTLVYDRVAAGEIDFSLGGYALIQAQARDLPLVAIANIHKLPPAALFARSDSGIVTPADLAGRRVAIKNEFWRALIGQMLEKFDLSLKDIVQVPSGFDMEPFYGGDVEVWAGFINEEVVRARLRGLDIITLPLHEYGLRIKTRTIYVSREMLENRPAVAERFVGAAIRGWLWAIENSEAAVDIMLELYPEMADERAFHLASLRASIPLWAPPDAQLGAIDCDAWRADPVLADLPSRDGVCTTSIFEAAQRRIAP